MTKKERRSQNETKIFHSVMRRSLYSIGGIFML